ncbi:uncharacterized protein LOC130711751 [Lotus japonicus]|uniref:uncharacterized protein LOC130711751 n=1 Tax=Lotus japonicus TaxID=34305 RepID=UPI0025872BFC|nr:uncharacterized protein LOC130711751 [Lotus japonicus]
MHGIKIARSAPTISHLLFADDNIVFSRADVRESECVRTILRTYELASGQVINLDKSMLSVSQDVPYNCFHELTQLLRVKAVENFDKYLDIDSMIARFFWGGDVSRRGLHWTKWENLCKNKCDGGLGFRDFRAFNEALVAKNWWRLYMYPDSLLDGSSLVYRQDAIESLGLEKVADLVVNGSWNTELLDEVFSPLTVQKIMAIPLSIQSNLDVLYWHGTSNSIYECKSGYNYIRSLVTREEASSSSRPLLSASHWRWFWSSPTLPRCKDVAWRAVQNFLPVRGELARRGMHLDPCCALCESEIETCEHLFLKCPAVERVWFASDMAMRKENFSSMHALMAAVLEEDDDDFTAAVQRLIYVTWEARNSLVFNGRRLEVVDVLRRAATLMPWNDGVQVSGPATGSSCASWKRPEIGVIKLNFDASIKNGQLWYSGKRLKWGGFRGCCFIPRKCSFSFAW